MAEEFRNDRKSHARTRTKRSVSVPQIMKTKILQPRVFANEIPRAVEVTSRTVRVVARDDIRPYRDQFGQHG